MWKAAKASYPQEWEKSMREIRSINPEAHKYLMQTPLRHWSKSWFRFDSKCDVLVNNMLDTFNSVILGPREKPIVTMFEEIRCYLMERWARNRSKMIELEAGAVLPNNKKKLLKERERSRFWMRRVSGDMLFEVYNRNQTSEQYAVNLDAQTCSCRSWMLTGIPGCHAITCYMDRKLDPDDYFHIFTEKRHMFLVMSHLSSQQMAKTYGKLHHTQTYYHHRCEKWQGDQKNQEIREITAAFANKLGTTKDHANPMQIHLRVRLHHKLLLKVDLNLHHIMLLLRMLLKLLLKLLLLGMLLKLLINQHLSQTMLKSMLSLLELTSPSQMQVYLKNFQPDKSATGTSSTQPTPNATKRTSALFKDMLATKTTVRPKMQPRKPSS
ncbi:hypothetical protein MTR_8g464800 [Medicago truncatula]|uniref:SWIM-type domain-containing protein n=1 Tax=Medicago truncatula TaxID=3880 RepID=A0A072U1C2_MEDTR|nr:hypothetical protein MTR_8g464800 [Medicago truncatula]